MKSDDYRNAAWQAQRTESNFMFDRVVRRLMLELPEVPVVTIHDSILTTCGNEGVIKGIMVAEFAKLGVHPTIHVED